MALQMKDTEQCFDMVLFSYVVVETFTSVDETSVYDHKWNLLWSAFIWYYAIQGGSLLNFFEGTQVRDSQSNTLMWNCIFVLYKVQCNVVFQSMM